MRSILLILCSLFCAVVAWGQGAPRVAKAVAAESEAPPASVRSASSIVLRPNDVFELRLSGMPPDDAQQFSGTQYTVGGDGKVSIPYAGSLQAAGRTPSELERSIERTLIDKRIFRWPTANINVATSVRFVVIGGNVRGPSRMPWSADLTLMSAIAAAGGPSDFAGDKIHLIRGGKITLYRYKQLQKEPSQDPRLLPSDQVDLR
jgi:protein involved in polysaccharide export with SLBB domain